jgi:hypothetical protein
MAPGKEARLPMIAPPAKATGIVGRAGSANSEIFSHYAGKWFSAPSSSDDISNIEMVNLD